MLQSMFDIFDTTFDVTSDDKNMMFIAYVFLLSRIDAKK